VSLNPTHLSAPIPKKRMSRDRCAGAGRSPSAASVRETGLALSRPTLAASRSREQMQLVILVLVVLDLGCQLELDLRFPDVAHLDELGRI